jgi:hypothetical protein
MHGLRENPADRPAAGPIFREIDSSLVKDRVVGKLRTNACPALFL